jgi:hypothetical protein
MPLITCEMRWLLDGALPGDTEQWFHRRGPQPASAPWREDRYVLPGIADMGIKEREGRLEIKGRLAVLGTHGVAPEVEGVAERWCKWSYQAAAIEVRCFQGPAIVVGKCRMQRHFLLEPGGRAEEAAQRDLTRRGFSVEITRIRLGAAGDDSHWSLGIEAAPDDAAMLADLLRAMPGVLRDFPMALPRQHSLSYPEWLARPKLDV